MEDAGPQASEFVAATNGRLQERQPLIPPTRPDSASGPSSAPQQLGPSLTMNKFVLGRADYQVGQSPTSMTLGDFNGDGTTDAAVVSTQDYAVTVLLGKPNGTMAVASVISLTGYITVPGVWDIAAGDFNGDGRQDLVLTDSFGNNVWVLISNGEGTFQPPVPYAASYEPCAVTVRDLNGDGKLDLIVSNPGGLPTISVFLGKGDGTFHPHVDYYADNAISSGFLQARVAVGDLNGDGKPDLAMTVGNGVSVLLGNGDGTFQPFAKYGIKSQLGYNPTGVTIGDFNGDKKLDLAVTWIGYQFSVVAILLGAGDGTFPAETDYPTGTWPQAVLAADLNGDGKLDLITQNQINSSPQMYGSISVLLGNGDGTFQGHVDYGTGVAAKMAVADFNGDGLVDLGVVSQSCSSYGTCGTGQLSLMLGKGDGTFEGTDYPAHNRPQAVAAADFNGDGKLDLAIAKDNFAQDNKTLSIMLNNGDGTFALAVDYLAGTGAYAVVTGDFNHDGKQDVAIPNLNESNVSIFLGKGDGTLQGRVDYPVYANPKGLIAGDFNNDGKLDLVSMGLGVNTLSLLLGNGDGTFRSHVDITVTNGVYDVKAGDFNGDGKLDLVVMDYGPAEIEVLLGNGDGTFQAPKTINVGNYSCRLAMGDFNGDGKADLAVHVCGDVVNSPFQVLLGNGDGTFQAPLQGYDSGMGPYASWITADLNGDGILDLAGPGIPGYSEIAPASVMYGNGDGSFQHHVEYGSSLGFVSVTAADLQGTGAMDLVGAAIIGDTLTGGVAVVRNTAQIALRPNRSTFYQQAIGDTSLPATFLVSSTGVAPLKLFNIAAVGDFSQTNMCPSVLAAGSNCTITGRFRPTVAGTRMGGVLIQDNAPSGLHAIHMSGLGYAIKLSNTGANFGIVKIGQTGTRQIGITNRGGIDIAVSKITIIGPDHGDFSQTNSCGTTILANSSCTMTLSFKPTKMGMKVAAVNIYDTDAVSPQAVVMRGMARMR